MSAIFSRVKSHMKDSYPGGRYLAMILAEVLRDAPRLAKAWFDVDGVDFDVVLEYPIEVDGHKKRVDLAFVATTGKRAGSPMVMVEIKYEDEKAPKIDAQLKDYISYCEQNKCGFILLTKNQPDACHFAPRGPLKPGQHRRYADLYRATSKHDDYERHPVARMLCDFLREETTVFDETKSDDIENILMLLLIRNLDLDAKNGLGALNKGDRVLESVRLLQQLVANMTILGNTFYERHGTGILANRPNVYYGFAPYYDYKKTAKHLGKGIEGNTKEDTLPISLRTGGFLYVNANYGFRKGKSEASLFLVNGFSIEIVPARAKPLKVEVFGRVWGDQESDGVKGVSTKGLFMETKMEKTLDEVTAQAIDASTGKGGKYAHSGSSGKRLLDLRAKIAK